MANKLGNTHRKQFLGRGISYRQIHAGQSNPRARKRRGSYTPIGRHKIVNANFYGKFRYYSGTLELPRNLLAAMKSDALRFIWRKDTQGLDKEEIGSSGAVMKCISAAAQGRPVKKGGASIMHWPNHLKSLSIQWIFKIAHPREASWQKLMEVWVPNIKTKLFSKLGSLAKRKILNAIPVGATYIRHAINQTISVARTAAKHLRRTWEPTQGSQGPRLSI